MLKISASALAIGVAALVGAAVPAAAQDDAVAAAKAFIETVTKPNPPWDGPTSGPAVKRRGVCSSCSCSGCPSCVRRAQRSCPHCLF